MDLQEKRLQLRSLAKLNLTAAKCLEHLAGRTNSFRETKARVLAKRTGSPHSEVLDVFRALEIIGVGTLLIGRKGFETRFRWDKGYLMTDVGKVAMAEMEELVEEPESAVVRAEEPEDDLRTWSFELRPNQMVEVRVPEDLTAREAARLAKFVEAIARE